MKKQKPLVTLDNDEDIDVVAPSRDDDSDISESEEITDMARFVIELNKDETDKDTGMSSIDQRAILSAVSYKAVLRTEALVGFKFLPIQGQVFARKIKRNSASLAGIGRKQIVAMAVGQEEKLQRRNIFGGAGSTSARGGNTQ